MLVLSRFQVRIRERISEDSPHFKNDGSRFDGPDATIKLKEGEEYVVSLRIEPPQTIQ